MATVDSSRRGILVLLIAALVLLAVMVRPLFSALLLAAVLAALIWPLHQRFSQKIGGRVRLSAALWLFGVVTLILGPMVAFVVFAISEAIQGFTFLAETFRSGGMQGLIERLPAPLADVAGKASSFLATQGVGSLTEELRAQLGAHGANAALAASATLSTTSSFAFQLTMMLIAFYFFLLQGAALVDWLEKLSPLKQGQTHELLIEFKSVSCTVLVSTAVTSAAQAIAALVGYWVASVPHPIFFAGLTFAVACIPAVGAAVVCLLAALLLFVTGHPYAAVFLALWGVGVVGLVDNLIKPILIKSGMQISGAVVFFSLVGGMSAFGGVGLLLGPMVIALFLSLIRIYQRDFAPQSPE